MPWRRRTSRPSRARRAGRGRGHGHGSRTRRAFCREMPLVLLPPPSPYERHVCHRPHQRSEGNVHSDYSPSELDGRRGNVRPDHGRRAKISASLSFFLKGLAAGHISFLEPFGAPPFSGWMPGLPSFLVASKTHLCYSIVTSRSSVKSATTYVSKTRT